jgi:hypothetical protein
MSRNTNETEKFRAECEARFVASHDGNWIKEYLGGVQEKRGQEAYNRLRNDVLKLWKGNDYENAN